MSVYLEKFQDLSFLQRRKKLLYMLHRSLVEGTSKYQEAIQEMVDAINHWEYRQLDFSSSRAGLTNFYKQVLEEVQANDPYQESTYFDEPQKSRKLLPNTVGIVLENLRSPFNVGAFFRMGEAFGIHEIIIIGRTPSPEKQQKVWKTAKGVLIPFRIFETIPSFLENTANITLVGIEKAKGSLSLENWSWTFQTPLYLVFGNEEFGIPPETLQVCNTYYHIPMMGAKNSLNVSVAGGIVLHHLAQQFQS